jgi:hypothetical protein
MKFWFFILILAVGGYLSGIVLDGIAMGDDSKLINLLTTGSLDSSWIPFSTTQEKLISFGILDNPSYSYVIPLIKHAQLAEGTQVVISHASISFGVGSTLMDPDGIPNSEDEYFADGITQCNFHSYDDVPFNTCVLCTLTSIEENGEHTPLAQGQMDLPDGYQASSRLEIPITEYAYEEANNFNNVDGVIVQLCDNGLGCTADFWQQEQSLESWPTSILPEETFESVFQRNIADIDGWSGQVNPTLLQVLSHSGTPINDLGANAVAALLNAETLGNSFAYTSEEVVSMTQQAIDDGNYETTKDLFSTENQLGCPF